MISAGNCSFSTLCSQLMRAIFHELKRPAFSSMMVLRVVAFVDLFLDDNLEIVDVPLLNLPQMMVDQW